MRPLTASALVQRFSDTLTICLLCAVLATTVLAYACDADGLTILTVFLVGIVTALTETIIRARRPHNGAGRE